jgi:hypothetical protein
MKSIKSLQYSKKKETLSSRRSLSLPEKNTKTPTPVPFTKHVNKMLDLKSFLSKLPDDLGNKITRTAYLQKTVEEKDMPVKDQKIVVLDKTKSDLSLKDIIKIFELNYFNYNNNDQYKDDDETIKILDNETIQVDILSSIAEDTPLTHRYCHKKLKIDNSDKYEIVLVHIRLNSQNDNNREEYVRTSFTDEQINELAFSQNIEAQDFYINNHIRDEYNNEIVKKLKYKDLINIFNSKIDNYSKVIKIINNLRSG